jgi:hypothetical protein
MARHLSLDVVRGALTILSDGKIVDCAKSCGVTESDWRLLTGSKIWIGTDRPRVKRLIDALLYGVVDMLGIPRFELPAEYASACIAFFVAPINTNTACAWVGTYARSQDLSDIHGSPESIQGLEKVSASQLFALVNKVRGGGVMQEFADSLKKKTGIFTAGVKKDEESNQKASTSK